MQVHLQEISCSVASGARASSSWTRLVSNTTPALQVDALLRPRGGTSQPLAPPPRSPEINPQKNMWQFLGQSYLFNRVFDGYVAIVEACCNAWNALPAEAGRIASIATRTWATISQ